MGLFDSFLAVPAGESLEDYKDLREQVLLFFIWNGAALFSGVASEAVF